MQYFLEYFAQFALINALDLGANNVLFKIGLFFLFLGSGTLILKQFLYKGLQYLH